MDAPTLTLTDLDSIRADLMRQLLTPEGQREIWRYDVSSARHALAWARGSQNYDDIMTGLENATGPQKPYALIGAGICDHYFATVDELKALIVWLCVDGYLSCYYADGLGVS